MFPRIFSSQFIRTIGQCINTLWTWMRHACVYVCMCLCLCSPKDCSGFPVKAQQLFFKDFAQYTDKNPAFTEIFGDIAFNFYQAMLHLESHIMKWTWAAYYEMLSESLPLLRASKTVSELKHTLNIRLQGLSGMESLSLSMSCHNNSRHVQFYMQSIRWVCWGFQSCFPNGTLEDLCPNS